MTTFTLLLIALMAIWLREVAVNGDNRYQRYKVSLYKQAEATAEARLEKESAV
jgi:hypothetical protein